DPATIDDASVTTRRRPRSEDDGPETANASPIPRPVEPIAGSIFTSDPPAARRSDRPLPHPGPALRAAAVEAPYAPPRPRTPVTRGRSTVARFEDQPALRFPSQPAPPVTPSLAEAATESALVIPKPPPLPQREAGEGGRPRGAKAPIRKPT